MESFIIGETLALQAATKMCVITQQTWKQIHADASSTMALSSDTVKRLRKHRNISTLQISYSIKF